MRVVFGGASLGPPAGSIMRGKPDGMPVEVGKGSAAAVDMDVCITILDGMGWAVLLSVPVGLIDVGADDELGVTSGPTAGATELDESIDVAVSLVAGVTTAPLVTGVATTLLELLAPDAVAVFVPEASSVVDVSDAAIPVDPETEVEVVGTAVEAPETVDDTLGMEVEAPETEDEPPGMEVVAPETEDDTPGMEVVAPEMDVELPNAEVDISCMEVEAPGREVETPTALLLSEVVVAIVAEPVVEPDIDPVVIVTATLPVSVDDSERLVPVVETDPDPDTPEGDTMLDGDTPVGTPVVEAGLLTLDVVIEPLATLVEVDDSPLAVVVVEILTMTGRVPPVVVPVELGDANVDVKPDATLFAKLEMTEFATDTKLETSPEDIGSGTTPPDETGVAVI